MTADDLMELVNRYTEACDDLGAGLFEQTEDQTQEKHTKAKELHGQILSEVCRLHAEAAKSERRAITFGDLMTRQGIAMQAALIEQATGKGDEAALEWIANTLEGPGLLPDFSEAAHLPKTPVDGPAQAWFDAKLAEHEAFRAAHPAP